MLSRIYLLVLVLSLASCSHFKDQGIKDEKLETLISFIPGEGEGKGRLGINRNQYLMTFEAVFKENRDWLLAISIPLHGEEVLLFEDLKQEKVEPQGQGLEARIEKGIRDYLISQNKSPELADDFLLELRRLIRIVFYKELNLDLKCTSSTCKMADEIYQVSADSKQITIKKSLTADYEIELVASNLTDSIFKRSSIFLHSRNKSSQTAPLLSLELFW